MIMKLTISEYMKKYGIKSKQTVYNKIKSGEIKKVKEGTRIFIVVKEKGEPDQEANPNIQEILKEIQTAREKTEGYIKELKEQIKDLKADKENLNERLREANILNLNNVEAIKSLTKTLELKNETAKELTQSKRSWISKIFKGNDENES